MKNFKFIKKRLFNVEPFSSPRDEAGELQDPFERRQPDHTGRLVGWEGVDERVGVNARLTNAHFRYRVSVRPVKRKLEAERDQARLRTCTVVSIRDVLEGRPLPLVDLDLTSPQMANGGCLMSEDANEDAMEQPRLDEAETSQAVATLSEIARQLRELADQACDLSRRPIFEPTFH
jgi:hypothetical protein